jgi:formate-dependent nitrite reductase membrane component NrfD
VLESDTTGMKGIFREQRQAAAEEPLRRIRHQASQAGPGKVPGVREGGAPSASPETGYYGLPLLKLPSWKWEVPAHFFTGGTAGAAGVIAGVGELCRADCRLIRDARWIAAMGGAASPLLLIADLGRPARFLNMLRIFKWRSPMSVGAWTLAVFSSSATAALLADLSGWERKTSLRVLRACSQVVTTLAGLPLASYTGVLLGATAVPVWAASVEELPILFAASGLGCAVSLLELKGHDANHALIRLGTASAATETAIAVRSMVQHNPALAAIRSGPWAWANHAGLFLAGPLPLALRLLAGSSRAKSSRRLRQAAALSTLVGSLVTRYAWLHAGRASAATS